jgi:hypothetical protein
MPYSVYASRDQPLLKRRHLKDERANAAPATTSKPSSGAFVGVPTNSLQLTRRELSYK